MSSRVEGLQPGGHVAIVGAGVIGLALALELVQAGLRVTVLESGRAMEASSWAAAGMLAVGDPENAPGLLPLARLSAALYPEFLQRMEELGGSRVPLRTMRTLQGRHGGGSPVPELPELRTDGYSFAMLEEASLDPRDLCAALPPAARAAGVNLRERTAVRAMRSAADGVAVELGDGETVEADRLVLAGGAWSGLLPLPGATAGGLPVAPRKGQMIEVTLDADAPALPFAVRTPELYLVPRGDGRIAIGATVEYAGFDRSVDVEAGDRLWESAGALWPPVLLGRVTARWTGLRPGYRAGIEDGLPVIGSLDGKAFAASGHFRNGILLAPGTARVLRELLGGENCSVDPRAFDPRRFLAAQGAETA